MLFFDHCYVQHKYASFNDAAKDAMNDIENLSPSELVARAKSLEGKVVTSFYDRVEGATNNPHYRKIFDLYIRAAEQGNAEAQYQVGRAYESGRGVLRDEWQAVEWFRKAAANSHAEARNELARRRIYE